MRKNYPFILLLILLWFQSNSQSINQPWKPYLDTAKMYSEKNSIENVKIYYLKADSVLSQDSSATITLANLKRDIGLTYINTRQNDKGEAYYLTAKEIFEQIGQVNSLDYALNCHYLGNLYLNTGKFQNAERLYSDSKKIRESVLGKENTLYAASCNNLGILYRLTGKYEMAEPLLLESLGIRERILGKNNSDYISSCNNLGIYYWEVNKYEKAEALYLEARQISERLFGKDHTTYLFICGNLGNLYNTTGEFSKAESIYIEVKELTERRVGNNHPDFASVCNNLGTLYKSMGQYEKAQTLFVEAKKIREVTIGKTHPDYSMVTMNLANLCMSMGQYKKAEQYLLEAKQLTEARAGTQHPDYAKVLHSLGSLYRELGEFENAASYFLKAKEIFEGKYGKVHENYASSCSSLSIIYWYMNLMDKAEPLALEAKQIREKLFGKNHPQYASSCNDLGNTYFSLGQIDDAFRYFTEGKLIYKNVFGEQNSNYSRGCINLANLYWAKGDLINSGRQFSEAIMSENEQLKSIFSFTSEAEKADYLQNKHNTTAHYFSFLLSLREKKDNTQAYDLLLSNRSLILHSLQQLRQSIRQSNDSSIITKFNNWITKKEQIAYWLTKPISKRFNRDSILKEEADLIEKELFGLSRNTGNSFLKDVHMSDVREKLKTGEAAIEFYSFKYNNGIRWTDSVYYIAMVLRKDRLEPDFVYLFEQKQLDSILRTKKEKHELTINAIYESPALYRLVWAPLEKCLEKISKIYFASSGVLHKINLGAIPTPGGKVFCDIYETVQLYSTASVDYFQSYLASATDKIVLYGGVNFNADSAKMKISAQPFFFHKENNLVFRSFDTNEENMPMLPATEREVDEISAMAKKNNFSVNVLKDHMANEESVKAGTGANSPELLHFATHGKFFSLPIKRDTESMFGGNIFKEYDNPLMRSMLFLAGANNIWKGKPVEGVEDGILTSYEISNMYLPNTKLAVLSACETGLGDISGSEGVYGLQRAFQLSGVKNLVMSLWKVPDFETSEFMIEFYKNIFNKKTISNAFQIARDSMKNKYRNEPYKWAAWILVR